MEVYSRISRRNRRSPCVRAGHVNNMNIGHKRAGEGRRLGLGLATVPSSGRVYNVDWQVPLLWTMEQMGAEIEWYLRNIQHVLNESERALLLIESWGEWIIIM